MNYKEIIGDLFEEIDTGNYDAVMHGCNCFCRMGSGIAVPMKNKFGCDKFPMEGKEYEGDINKLGTIDYQVVNIPLYRELPVVGKSIDFGGRDITVINAYTQYHYASHPESKKVPFDYHAFVLICKKITHIFKGKNIVLPMIGAGLAKGNWKLIKQALESVANATNITVVKLPDYKITREELAIVQKTTLAYMDTYPEWRKGQAYFNALYEIHFNLSEYVRGTDCDMYYNDSIISKFESKFVL